VFIITFLCQVFPARALAGRFLIEPPAELLILFGKGLFYGVFSDFCNLGFHKWGLCLPQSCARRFKLAAGRAGQPPENAGKKTVSRDVFVSTCITFRILGVISLDESAQTTK
jgi:hypothetical protein